MAAHPPSKPHVEGDGFSQPHVLHWESPGTRGINGYSVQVKVDGPAGDGKFHSLLADTKSKSTKASLSSLTLSAGHSYTFRVAAHISGGGWGPYSEPSEPIQGGGGGGGGSKPSSPQARRRGVPKDGGGGGGASSSAAPESAADLKAELAAWESAFKQTHGRSAYDNDRLESADYQALVKKYKAAKRGDRGGGDRGSGGGGGRSDTTPRRERGRDRSRGRRRDRGSGGGRRWRELARAAAAGVGRGARGARGGGAAGASALAMGRRILPAAEPSAAAGGAYRVAVLCGDLSEASRREE